ncbi:MAG: hypothetical protein PVH00_13915, partial [Gemmatimonadota bacterium]
MDAIQRVRNMVRHSLVVKPDVRNEELLDRAREIAPEVVKDLSIRQFHAKFRLPVLRHEMGRKKRQQRDAHRSDAGGSTAGANATRKSSRKGTARTTRSRSRARAERSASVREVLVEFAMELEKAESRTELVRVMGDVDRWTARILEAVQPPGSAASAPD